MVKCHRDAINLRALTPFFFKGSDPFFFFEKFRGLY